MAAIVSYVGAQDAALQVGNAVSPLKVLSFGGVFIDVTANYNTIPAIQNGTYPFWSYGHLYLAAGISSDKTRALTSIAQDLVNYNAPILLKNLNVSRSTDGGAIIY